LTISNFSYPTASNRLGSEIDTTAFGATRQYYAYNADGSRREDYEPSGGADASGYTVPNSCSHDPDGRMFQACSSTSVVLLGENVVRDQTHGWLYGHAPGIGEPLVAVKRFNSDQSASAAHIPHWLASRDRRMFVVHDPAARPAVRDLVRRTSQDR
jgi:hypothetical protein